MGAMQGSRDKVGGALGGEVKPNPLLGFQQGRTKPWTLVSANSSAQGYGQSGHVLGAVWGKQWSFLPHHWSRKKVTSETILEPLRVQGPFQYCAERLQKLLREERLVLGEVGVGTPGALSPQDWCERWKTPVSRHCCPTSAAGGKFNPVKHLALSKCFPGSWNE